METWRFIFGCIGIFMIPLAIVNIYRNGIQGMGYGLLPMMAGVAELVGRGATASWPLITAVISVPVWPVLWPGSWLPPCFL